MKNRISEFYDFFYRDFVITEWTTANNKWPSKDLTLELLGLKKFFSLPLIIKETYNSDIYSTTMNFLIDVSVKSFKIVKVYVCYAKL